MKDRNGSMDVVWKMIWGWSGIKRIKFFLWLVAHGRLCTNDRRAIWSGCNPMCSLCSNQVESILHVLRYCDHAYNVWDRVLPIQRRRDFFSVDIRCWILSNRSQNVVGKVWSVTFGVTCWLLWTWRNKRLFDGNFVYPSRRDHVINNWVEWIINAKPEFFSSLAIKSQTEKLLIRWFPPPNWWIKASSDGAVNSVTKSAACGGLLRDFDGQWRGGILWGMCEILKLAWISGFKNVLLECDSKVAVELVAKGRNLGERCGVGVAL